MALNKLTGEALVDGTLDSDAIGTASVTHDKLHSNIISSQTVISTVDASNDLLLIYDNDTSSLKKVSISNVRTTNTDGLTEGSANLYFTNARADARISNAIKDEDNMASNSATHIPSQQSVKAYVDTEVAGLVDSAPSTLDTLNELAAALGDDANFSTTITTSIATKLPLAGGTLTGNLSMENTDAGSAAGPEFTLFRNSASAANADYLGQIKFDGKNDAAQTIVYAKITGKILDASDGTEDGIIEIAHKKAGSNNISARFRSDSLQLINGTNLTVAGTTELTGTLGIGVAPSSAIGVYSTKSLANGLAAQLTNTESSTGSGLVVKGGNNSSTYSADFRDYNNTTLMRIRGDGNVGIGTDNPVKKLDVDGDFYIRDDHMLHMGTVDISLWDNNNGTGGINMRGGTSGTYAAIAETAATGYSNLYLNKINVTSDISENANRFIDFYYDGVSAVRVRGNSSKDLSFDMHGGGNFLLPSGNVGIGTSNPGARLEILSDGSNDDGAEVLLKHANNNTSDVISTIKFANNAGSAAMIQAGTTGANNSGYIDFFTDNAGTSTRVARMTPDGNVGIGGATGRLMSGYDSVSNTLTIYDSTISRSGYLELASLANGNGYTAGAITFINNANSNNSAPENANSKTVAQIRAETVTSDNNAGDDAGSDLCIFTKPEAGGLQRIMTLTGSGYVSIGGNHSPVEPLDLRFSGRHGVIVGSTNGNGSYIVLDGAGNGDAAGSDYAYIEHTSSGNLNFNVGNGSNSTNTKMLIEPGGNVGIGTANSSYKLDISGVGAEQLRLKSNGDTGYTQGAMIIESSNSSNNPGNRGQGVYYYNVPNLRTWYTGTLYNNGNKFGFGYRQASGFQQDAADNLHAVMVIDGDSKEVGIGVTNPSATLHVEDDGTGGNSGHMKIGHTRTRTFYAGISSSENRWYKVLNYGGGNMFTGKIQIYVTRGGGYNQTGAHKEYRASLGGYSNSVYGPLSLSGDGGEGGVASLEVGTDAGIYLRVNSSIYGGTVYVTFSGQGGMSWAYSNSSYSTSLP